MGFWGFGVVECLGVVPDQVISAILLGMLEPLHVGNEASDEAEDDDCDGQTVVGPIYEEVGQRDRVAHDVVVLFDLVLVVQLLFDMCEGFDVQLVFITVVVLEVNERLAHGGAVWSLHADDC